jgi:hypothetical protein
LLKRLERLETGSFECLDSDAVLLRTPNGSIFAILASRGGRAGGMRLSSKSPSPERAKLRKMMKTSKYDENFKK